MNELVGIYSIKMNGTLIYQHKPVGIPKRETSDILKEKPPVLKSIREVVE